VRYVFIAEVSGSYVWPGLETGLFGGQYKEGILFYRRDVKANIAS